MSARGTCSVVTLATMIALTSCAATPAQPSSSDVVATVSPKPSVSPLSEEVPPPEEVPASEVPRKPEFDELVITSSALGSLRVGHPASESDMVFFTPDACYVEGGTPGVPENQRWLSTYSVEESQADEFTVGVDADGIVTYLNVKSERLSTENGIHVGSTLEELMAAYPTIQTTHAGALSTVYSSTDDDGTLTFEVPTVDYWPEFGDRVVVVGIHGSNANTIGPIVGGDGGAGSCF